MTYAVLWKIEMIPWYVFMIYWGVSAFRVKATQAMEPLAARLYTMGAIAAVFFLLFSDRFSSGRLAHRFLPPAQWLDLAAIVFTYAGIGLAIWARWNLGQNWSARVTVKVDHELIRSGPYARLRHPIYSGLLLAVIGIALMIGEVRGLVAVAVIAVVHSLKAKREEALMLATFGDKYRDYSREAGFLLPRI
jgi:protein-S-isoprenylcysteine O-methyltransferase Ste14